MLRVLSFSLLSCLLMPHARAEEGAKVPVRPLVEGRYTTLSGRDHAAVGASHYYGRNGLPMLMTSPSPPKAQYAWVFQKANDGRFVSHHRVDLSSGSVVQHKLTLIPEWDGFKILHRDVSDNPDRYHLAREEYFRVYERLLEKETNAAEQKKWKLFLAISQRELPSLKTLLGEVNLREAVDPLHRRPLDVAILLGYEEGVQAILSVEGGFPLLPTRDTADPFEVALSSDFYDVETSVPIIRHLLGRQEATNERASLKSSLGPWVTINWILAKEILPKATQFEVRDKALVGVLNLLKKANKDALVPLIKEIVKTGPSEEANAYAVEHLLGQGFSDVVSQLIEWGINPESRNEKKESLLLIAIRRRAPEIVKRLTENYRVSMTEEDREKALTIAAVNCDQGMLKLFADEKNVMKPVGPKGELPATLVAQAYFNLDPSYDPTGAISILLSKSADGEIGINAKDGQGLSVLDVVANAIDVVNRQGGGDPGSRLRKHRDYLYDSYTWLQYGEEAGREIEAAKLRAGAKLLAAKPPMARDTFLGPGSSGYSYGRPIPTASTPQLPTIMRDGREQPNQYYHPDRGYMYRPNGDLKIQYRKYPLGGIFSFGM